MWILTSEKVTNFYVQQMQYNTSFKKCPHWLPLVKMKIAQAVQKLRSVNFTAQYPLKMTMRGIPERILLRNSGFTIVIRNLRPCKVAVKFPNIIHTPLLHTPGKATSLGTLAWFATHVNWELSKRWRWKFTCTSPTFQPHRIKSHPIQTWIVEIFFSSSQLETLFDSGNNYMSTAGVPRE